MIDDTRLTNFIAAVFPDVQQSICLRAFKAKDAPDDPVIHPLTWQVSKAQLLSPALQKEPIAANKTRGIYFVVNSGGNKNEDIAQFNALFVEIDMPEADWRDETRRAEQIAEQEKLFLSASLKPSIITETLRGLSAFWLIQPVGEEQRGKRRYTNKTVRGTKRDAQKWLNGALRDQDSGVFVEPAAITLNEYLDKWLEVAARPRVSRRTADGYAGLLERYIRPAIGRKRLDS